MEDKNLLKDSKAYYEDNDYYEIFSNCEDSKDEIKKLFREISKNKIVLDAGCGTGKFIDVLEENSSKYIGIDLSSKQLEKAKAKSKKTSSLFINSNLSNIELEDNSIDLIVSNWVLGTITDLDEREKCLQELKRVLKPNGSIYLIENAENSEFEYIRNHTTDSRTKDYNTWILKHGFDTYRRINTYFEFETLEIAQKCFNVIYGEEISSKIKNRIIEHEIITFKYIKK